MKITKKSIKIIFLNNCATEVRTKFYLIFNNLIAKFQKTSLKWLTVAMPLLETSERQERNKRKTRDGLT